MHGVGELRVVGLEGPDAVGVQVEQEFEGVPHRIVAGVQAAHPRRWIRHQRRVPAVRDSR